MELIETVTVGSGGAASIEFTSIPQDGTDLWLLINARDSNPLVGPSIFVRVNSDSSSNYTLVRLRGDGSTADSLTFTTTRFRPVITGSLATANTFSNNSFYFSNYSGSTNKSVSIDSVNENNATDADQLLFAGIYNDTAAITSISLTPATSFVEHSTASLYKITSGSDGITSVS
jgi:hypothetical protein